MRNFILNSCLVIILSLLPFYVSGQLGGKSVFPFLNLPPSARSTAMGGSVISHQDADLATTFQNPALLNAKLDNNLSLNYINHLSDINYGFFNYAKDYNQKGTYAINILYLNYGNFEGYDETGEYTGNFSASEFAVGVSGSWAYKEKFRYGTTVKFIYSDLYSYISTGLALDLGGLYHDEEKNITLGLVLKNIGYQTIVYRETDRMPLPFEIQFAVSKKPKHAPFRLTMMFHNLQRPDLSNNYIDPSLRTLDSDDNQVYKVSLGDKIIRHVSVGLEFLLSENFHIRAGYNHLRRRELTVPYKKGVAGFSWGIAFKIKKIRMEYGSAALFPGYNTNQFSVLLNLNDFYTRKSKN